MSTTEVIHITDADLNWSFGTPNPYFSVRHGSYGSSESVDPFPCYGHNVDLVRSELERTASLCPLPFPVYVYVSEFEDPARTNAHASVGYNYDSEKINDEYEISSGTIVLSGKRIPIHPAMTRYLVSHEYGHLVDSWLCRQNKGFSREKYAEIRGVETPRFYGGRTWHKSIGEIFANDFRIVVCRREMEFWPHEVPHPLHVAPHVMDFWLDQLPALPVDDRV